MKDKKIIKAIKALSNSNRFKLFIEISKSNKSNYKKEEYFV